MNGKKKVIGFKYEEFYSCLLPSDVRKNRGKIS